MKNKQTKSVGSVEPIQLKIFNWVAKVLVAIIQLVTMVTIGYSITLFTALSVVPFIGANVSMAMSLTTESPLIDIMGLFIFPMLAITMTLVWVVTMILRACDKSLTFLAKHLLAWLHKVTIGKHLAVQEKGDK